MFFILQSKQKRTEYELSLKNIGKLSRLFSESDHVYLETRIAERVFCLSFGIENVSRDDSSIDARSKNSGIGIKTFQVGANNPSVSSQKIAQFKKLNSDLNHLINNPKDLIYEIAKAKNDRLNLARSTYGVKNLYYHYIVRTGEKFSIHESNMDFLDIDKIEIVNSNKKRILFTDGINNYKYTISDSQLWKDFDLTNSLHSFNTAILGNPFEIINNTITDLEINKFDKKSSNNYVTENNHVIGLNAIYLPLYSSKSKNLDVGEKSGLNQWNAGGRKRNSDEIYIPVPIWIHQKFPQFFPNNNIEKFGLILPNGKKLIAKMCQANLKGLMSNPNKALGKWLLRDVLNLDEGELVTRNLLDKLNIDSVLIVKKNNDYYIDFHKLGSYENFKEEYDQ